MTEHNAYSSGTMMSSYYYRVSHPKTQ